jgi:hypothetical protein
MAVDYFTIRKGLEISTDLTSGAVVVQILNGSADPTSVATPANIGSLYLRDNGVHYRKTGAPDTAWESDPDLTSISADLATLSAAIDNNTTNITTISGDISNLSGSIDINTGDITTIENQLTSGFVTTTTNQTVSGNKSFVNDITISGDLTVFGTTTSLSAVDLEISDNTILLNSGETGAGVTLGTAGIEIDRGTESNVTLRWNETTDTWQITFDGVTYYDILTELDLSTTDLSTLSAAIDQNSTDITNISGVVGTLSGGNYIVGTTVAGDLVLLDSNLATVSADLDTVETLIGTLSAGNYIAGVEVATDLVNLDNNLFTVSGDLDALETIVGAPLSAGSVIGGVTVADDLVALDNFVSSLSLPLTGGATGVTSPTVIDTVPLASFDVVGWEVMASLDSAPTTRRRAIRINALHDGTDADVDTYSLLTRGASWAGIDIDVVVSGALLALVVDSTPATSFKSLRIFNL